MFFDGRIRLDSSVTAVHVGKATIYSSEEIRLEGNFLLCGVATCDGTWDPSVNLLALVTGGSASACDFEIRNNATLSYVPIATVLPGMPWDNRPVTKLENAPGSFTS